MSPHRRLNFPEGSTRGTDLPGVPLAAQQLDPAASGEDARGGAGPEDGANRREVNRTEPTRGAGTVSTNRDQLGERAGPNLDRVEFGGPRADLPESVRERAPRGSPRRTAPGAAEGTSRGEG